MYGTFILGWTFVDDMWNLPLRDELEAFCLAAGLECVVTKAEANLGG